MLTILVLSLVLQSCVYSDQLDNSTQSIKNTENEAARLKCGEKEFQETRSNYESCASDKIASVTTWLQKVTTGEQNEDQVVISEVCSHVQDLLHSCGDELGWCFTAAQVEETKRVQKSGIQEILRKHLSEEKVIACLLPTNRSTGSVSPSKARPRSLKISSTTSNSSAATEDESIGSLDKPSIADKLDHVYDLIQDSDKNEQSDTPSFTLPTTPTVISTTSATLKTKTTSRDQSTITSTTTSAFTTSRQMVGRTESKSNYPTECPSPTCGAMMSTSHVLPMILTLIYIFCEQII